MLRKVNLICVGSLKKDYLKSLEKEYIKNINLINIKESGLESESEEILRHLNKMNNRFSILFDLEGKKLCNNVINDIKENITKGNNVSFIIGGSNGVSNKLKKSCNLLLKLSDLTYTHQIFRISGILFIRKLIG